MPEEVDAAVRQLCLRVLFVATGALLSPVSTQQGESIPSIAHAISITTSPER